MVVQTLDRVSRKHRFSPLIVKLCILVQCTFVAQLSHAALQSGQVYAVVNAGSGLGIDTAGASMNNGAILQQWGTGAGAHQQVIARATGNGLWTLELRHSGKLIDVNGAATWPGAPVIQWAANGQANQQWQITETVTGRYRVASANSGQVLSVAQNATRSGAALVQDYDFGNDFQRWDFRLLKGYVNPASNTAASGQVYRLENVGSGKSLDVAGASTANRANVQQWGYGGGIHQQFVLRQTSYGDWNIEAQHSGSMLDVAGNSTDDGGNIHQHSANGYSNQRWQFNRLSDGTYQIRSVRSGHLLSPQFFQTGSGTSVVQAADVDSPFQRWRLSTIEFAADNGSDGFAAQPGRDGLRSTTGGGQSNPWRVYNCQDLKQALTSPYPQVVQIPDNVTIDCRTAPRDQVACPIDCGYSDPGKTFYRVPVGSQTCTSLGSVSNATVTRSRNETGIHLESNKTLIGGRNSKVRGASFNLNGRSNIIIRNLEIWDVNPGLIEAGDGIGLDNSTHVWIDHVRLGLISDGYIDVRNSENVTLSWNHLDGRNPAVCGSQHHYTALVSESQVTLHHNYWDEVSGRNPKLTGSRTRAHLFNNYWRNVTYFSISASGGAQARVEGNFFENSSRPHWNENFSAFIEAPQNSNIYVLRSAEEKQNKDAWGSVFADLKMYAYKVDDASRIPTAVSQGAGPR